MQRLSQNRNGEGSGGVTHQGGQREGEKDRRRRVNGTGSNENSVKSERGELIASLLHTPYEQDWELRGGKSDTPEVARALDDHERNCSSTTMTAIADREPCKTHAKRYSSTLERVWKG